MLELVDTVRSGRLGWRLTLVAAGETDGSEVDAVELHLADMDAGLRRHPNFAAAAKMLRGAWENARGREPYGARKQRAGGRSTRTTTLSVVAARAAAAMLGLSPPSPKSLETLAARYR